LGIDGLEELIKPINFYKTKAKHLLAVSKAVIDAAGPGHPAVPYHVPRTYRGLTALPGVGPKVALCVLTVVFGHTQAGVVVDSNLFRLCNRLGINGDTSHSGGGGGGSGAGSPEVTRKYLEKWLPKDEWADFSVHGIALAQAVCVPGPGKPRCRQCPMSGVSGNGNDEKALCPSAELF
jgi:endonuclease-3